MSIGIGEPPRIGPYTPVRLLGEGPTVHTYLYRHEQRKRYAVLKLTHVPLVTLEEKETFLKRARLLQKLKHRYITEILDFGLHAAGEPADDYGYLVVQYIEGSTIETRFPARQCHAPDEVRRVLLSLADTLQYAHKMFATHGNLHPGNVLQTEKDFFLTDFSLALPATHNDAHSRALLYRAPEQLRDPAGAPTPVGDQYALAVMAYEWICGRRPYPATTSRELLFQQEHEPLPLPVDLNDRINPLVQQVLLQALAVEPRARFPHTLAFADAYLRALMGLAPIPVVQTGVAPASHTLAPAQPITRSAKLPGTSTPVTATPSPELLPAPPAVQSIAAPIRQEIEAEPERARAAQLTLAPASVHTPAPAPAIDENPAQRTRTVPPSAEPGHLQRRVEADLRQGGILSRVLPGYEERPAQIEMAGLVARAITENVPVITEASTGTGKSLAYLIPIVHSGKVAIVSTANKALQEQLFFKDIPFIQKYIRRVDAALVKGMGNYLCLDRIEQERLGIQHYVKNRDFIRLLERIEESENDERFTGDIETLGFTLPAEIRAKVNADRDQCTWSKCGYFSECYVRKMRSRASQASIIVVNHTLLLLDAFMEGSLLPERDLIVVDEAHHLEEEATRAFTTTISQGQISTLLAQHMLRDHTPASLQEETRATMNLTWERLGQLFDPGTKGRTNLREPLQEGLGLATLVGKLADELRTGRPKDLSEKDEQLYDKLVSRAQNLTDNIRMVFSVNQPEKYVYYVERVLTGGRRGLIQLEVSAAPLEVTSWLKEQLFDKANVVCTSATLATIGPDPAHPEIKGPNFAYFRHRVGLDHESYSNVQERILPLTFDYETHALLYVPRHLPEPAYGTGPAAQAYTQAIGREMMKLVEASRGRAFLLFSSKRMLDEVFDLFGRELPGHLKFPLLRQGDMARMELVRSFRERAGAVLFGLKSFWEGVDIAGDALSLVVIDKLPFDPPDDPVHEARVARMKAAGENWFGTFVLPQTVLRLKQGLGRLLRTHNDRGVMAILDTRLYTKGYGKQIVLALPPARRTASLDSVVRFFQEETEDAPF